MSIFPCGVLTHILVGISVAMALLVCLVHDIHAITVAELIEILAVGVVTGAQEVDVGLLHQSDVFLVCSVVHISSCPGMMVMAVHTSQLNVLAVHLEHLSHTFHSLHSEMIVEVFRYIAFIVKKLDTERIEVRLGSRPQAWIVDGVFKQSGDSISDSYIPHSALNVCSVDVQAYAHASRRFASHVAYLHIGGDRGLGVVGIRLCLHSIVGNMHKGAHPQLHRTEDSAQPPHILVFEIAAVAPAVYLNSKTVLSPVQIIRDVKLGRRHGVLAIPHPLAVHPYIHR